MDLEGVGVGIGRDGRSNGAANPRPHVSLGAPVNHLPLTAWGDSLACP